MIYKKIQDLSPKWAYFCLEVESFVIKHLKIDIYGKKLLLGVSGGIDSTALFFIFWFLSSRLKTELFVAHLNHGIRTKAREEADFVEHMCKEFSVPFYRGNTNVRLFIKKKKMGLEEGGRVLRYRFLHGILKNKGFDFILLGHQLNDLAEDILLKLIRGSYWPQIGGMDAYDKKRRILRPLLLTPKHTLKDFLNYLNVKWVEDESNEDLRFKRNRIRHKILPLFIEENPNFLEVTKRIWVLSRIDNEYWDTVISTLKGYENRKENGVFIKKREVMSLPKALRLRWYKKLLTSLGKGEVITSTLLDLDKCVEEKKSGKTFLFPGNKVVLVTKQDLLFLKE